MLRCFLSGAVRCRLLTVQLPVKISRLHLLLDEALRLLAGVAWDGRQLGILAAVFLQKLLGFAGSRVQVHPVASILTLT